MPDIRNPIVNRFYTESLSDDIGASRAILVFGRNSATYKFALMKTLMAKSATSSLKYSDIGEQFLMFLLEHHKSCPHQFQGGNNKLTVAMDQYIQNEMEWLELFKIAEASIYKDVFKAFQNIGKGSVDDSHTLFENDKKNKRIVLTDNLNLILEDPLLKKQVSDEAEARWRVVEEAWRINVSPLLTYDESDRSFYTKTSDFRVNLRSAVDTLRPYQRGFCFYCGCPLAQESENHHHPQFPDIDHFIPLSKIVQLGLVSVNPNGVWNLVIACRDCNRGNEGKSDQVPERSYFEKLLTRNEYFTEEHKHAMKFSVLQSLGVNNQKELRSIHVRIYKQFDAVSKWTPKRIWQPA
jgi:5-methylcytosine-specific restriction endonuclease McrA